MATILDGVWTNRIDVEMGTTYGSNWPSNVKDGNLFPEAVKIDKNVKLTKTL